MHNRLGKKVGHACDGATDASCVGGRKVVAAARKYGKVLDISALRRQVDHLRDRVAGEFGADNLGMPAQSRNSRCGQVDAVCDAGEVVDEDGDGRSVRQGVKILHQHIIRHLPDKEAWGQGQHGGGACLAGVLAVGRRLNQTLAAGAGKHKHLLEARLIKSFSHVLDDFLPLLSRQGDGFTRGSLQDDALDARLGHADGVAQGGVEVNGLLSIVLVEGEDRGVDASGEEAAHCLLAGVGWSRGKISVGAWGSPHNTITVGAVGEQ